MPKHQRMKLSSLANKFDDALVGSTRFRLAMIFIIVPSTIFLLDILLGEGLILGGMVIIGSYCIALLIGALSSALDDQGIFRICRTFIALTSPFVLGSLVFLVYVGLWIVYLLFVGRLDF
ncbi:MAG: hypothetical protein LC754_01465 [Acidobacteria bacterium]|nr:hypothetical protein [Acidobacteriota bacterium]